MTKKRLSIKAPQTDESADQYLREIGKLQIQLRDLDTKLRDRTAKLKQQIEDTAAPVKARKAELEAGLTAWAEANRDRLTNGGRSKTAKLPSGDIKWRTLPPKVSLRGIPSIIEYLKLNALARFVRTKEEVDKDAMLKEPEIAGQVPGVKIGSEGEQVDFQVAETKLDGAGS